MRNSTKSAVLFALLALLWPATSALSQVRDSVGVPDSLAVPDSMAVADSIAVPDSVVPAVAADDGEVTGAFHEIEYRLLATKRTSTLERELNEAADAGFRVEGMIGGETAFGGNEVVAIMSRDVAGEHDPRYQYKILATNRTSTMQSEMQAAGDAGYTFRSQTVLETLFGGTEVIVVMERDRDAPESAYDHKLLATSRTSTMQDELMEAGRQGYTFAGVTVAETLMGGEEVVVITSRPRPTE